MGQQQVKGHLGEAESFPRVREWWRGLLKCMGSSDRQAGVKSYFAIYWLCDSGNVDECFSDLSHHWQNQDNNKSHLVDNLCSTMFDTHRQRSLNPVESSSSFSSKSGNWLSLFFVLLLLMMLLLVVICFSSCLFSFCSSIWHWRKIYRNVLETGEMKVSQPYLIHETSELTEINSVNQHALTALWPEKEKNAGYLCS